MNGAIVSVKKRKLYNSPMPRIRVDHIEPDASPKEAAPPASPTEASPTDKQLRSQTGTSFLAAFSAFPKNIFFAGREEGEDILLLLRAHPITTLPWILVTLGLILTPIIIFPLFAAANILPFVGVGSALIFTLLWYLATFTDAFINFLYWYFNVYIVTNERVVDLDWYSIIYRKVSSCQISKIQDVSTVQAGVFAGIFDFGNVVIQTAAEFPNFEFTAVPHPQLVAKKIQELMQEEEPE